MKSSFVFIAFLIYLCPCFSQSKSINNFIISDISFAGQIFVLNNLKFPELKINPLISDPKIKSYKKLIQTEIEIDTARLNNKNQAIKHLTSYHYDSAGKLRRVEYYKIDNTTRDTIGHRLIDFIYYESRLIKIIKIGPPDFIVNHMDKFPQDTEYTYIKYNHNFTTITYRDNKGKTDTFEQRDIIDSFGNTMVRILIKSKFIEPSILTIVYNNNFISVCKTGGYNVMSTSSQWFYANKVSNKLLLTESNFISDRPPFYQAIITRNKYYKKNSRKIIQELNRYSLYSGSMSQTQKSINVYKYYKNGFLKSDSYMLLYFKNGKLVRRQVPVSKYYTYQFYN